MIKIRVSGRFDLDYKRLILSEPELKEVVWTKIKGKMGF